MAEAADKSAEVDMEAAEDGANPKVTILPSATRPHSGRGSDLGERTPQQKPYRFTVGRAGSGLQFFLPNLVAATSNWGHWRFCGDPPLISLHTGFTKPPDAAQHRRTAA
ncbi:hypothetical protein SGFS_037170 [Streptomyces graminofaciens]|uniref:Uncharacterized protein n=1 Tax=Streptomyces graminofaciens TaxID=68212 RepID=A0ABM7F9H0_9ACTN|nr:hypothetical protein SGFS_037170 [Streptomyces graminofaciens]